jgi:hypothetical protein
VNNQRDLIRYDEAVQFVQTVQSPLVRAALSYALTNVLVGKRMDAGVLPAAPFDLRFYLESVKSMFENERVIRAIMDGNESDLDW